MSAPKLELLDWLLDNLHRIEVHTDNVYCEGNKELAAQPALSFRYVELQNFKRWSLKSDSQQRLLEKLYALMEQDKRPSEAETDLTTHDKP